jgi:two-component system cell cycle response regulator DivK
MPSINETPPAPSADTPSILVVEDDRDTREMYSGFLISAGFRVVQAHNGLQALEKAIDERPALVVTDLYLPGLDGFELARALQADERTKSIPVIAVTGRNAVVGDRVRVNRAGFKAVLLKPCLPEHLQLEVERVLGERRSSGARP